MQIQKTFMKASESYEENGFFYLKETEFDLLIKKIRELNQIKNLSSLQILEAKGIFTILFYAEKEDSVENQHLNKKMRSLFEEVKNEFCYDEES